jgi:PKD repeat protein
MKKQCHSIIISLLLITTGFSIVSSTENHVFAPTYSPISGSENYTYYWIIGQLPSQSHVYLYARNGANVTFAGTIVTPVNISVPKDEFVSHNLGDIGYTQIGTQWYFLEMFSDNPVMVHFDRAVYLKTGSSKWEWKHGDTIHNKPHMELSTTYYIPYGGSGSGDDLIVMFAHESTEVTVRMLGNSGSVWTSTMTINGLFVSNHLDLWLGSIIGYSLLITANKPIAALCFDELGNYPLVYGSGYYFSGAFYTELYSEYMQVQTSPSQYHNIYTPTANTFEYYDMSGVLVGSRVYSKEKSNIVYFNTVGYSFPPDPYLVHTKTSQPYANSHMSPTKYYFTDTAGFMGWNSSMGVLDIYADSDTHISIYNGRDDTLVLEFDMDAHTIFRDTLANVGFAEAQPFLTVIESDVPVYQSVKIPNYLRPYPAEVAPPVSLPPVADAGDDHFVNEGDDVELDGSNSYDPDGIIDIYEWDFESDGIYDYTETVDNAPDGTFDGKTNHIWGDDGVYTATLRVTDDSGNSDTDSCDITVSNVIPTIQPLGSFSVNEGSSLSVTVIASDPGSDDLTFTWDFGDGSSTVMYEYYNDGLNPEPPYSSITNEIKTPLGSYPFSTTDSQSHTYGDDGIYTITLTVEDDDGGTSTMSSNVLVNNVAPTITLLIAPSGDEGSSLTFFAEAADSGSDDLTFTWEFELGPTIVNNYFNDGLGPEPVYDPITNVIKSPLGSFPYSVSDTVMYTYGDNHNYSLTLIVTDDDGGSVSINTTVSINNLSPSITDIIIPVNIFEGASATFEASAFDLGSDDLTFNWNFEMGSSINNIHYNDGIDSDPSPSPWGTFPFNVSDSVDHTYGDQLRLIQLYMILEVMTSQLYGIGVMDFQVKSPHFITMMAWDLIYFPVQISIP